MPEMFAVPAVATALLHPVIFGQSQRRFAYDVGNRLEPLRMQALGIDGDARVDQRALAVVDVKHLAGIGPEIVDRSLRAALAFLGAVAEPANPFRGVPEMLDAFLLRLCRDPSH